MAQGRSKAMQAKDTTALVVLFMIIINIEFVAAKKKHYVGGDGGWTFNIQDWSHDKKFYVGDTLVFKYVPGFHNVVKVNSKDYNECRQTPGAVVHVSGNDRIKIHVGDSYFICSFPGHCEAGMKLAINAI